MFEFKRLAVAVRRRKNALYKTRKESQCRYVLARDLLRTGVPSLDERPALVSASAAASRQVGSHTWRGRGERRRETG